MSEWVERYLPCPKCSSTDAFSINTEGWGKCFSCGENIKVDGDYEPSKTRKPRMAEDLITNGEVTPLPARKITEETCKKFGYQVGKSKGKTVQIAPYRKDGTIVAQKLRGKDKAFSTTGDFKGVELFGQHLWGEGGKKLIITEGEIDCMTVSQLQGNKWPVVSLPSGAQSAVSSIKTNLEWVMTFEEVILMFDNDDAGKEATEKVCELLPIGMAKVATLPLKDPNEMLLAGRGQEVIQAIWNAKTYRPDGILSIDEILDDIEKPIEIGLPWFLEPLTKLTYGRRWGEVYGFGAGTGIGKTDLFTQQIAYDVTELNQMVGVFYLEAKPVDTGKRIAGKVDGKRYHVPDAEWDTDQLKSTLGNLKGKVYFYDSWGETEWDVIRGKIRFMATSLGVRIFYLDHLTAMADTSNEKESLEQLMKELAGIANELNIIVHFVSHLTTPEGKPHEEGGRVMIRHFKGSRAIGFWSYFMFGLERNQQAEDPEERQTTILRILKDRYTGQATGEVILLGYDVSTGRLFEKTGYEVPAPFEDETIAGADASSDF